jgi:hypothetical protein
MNWLKALTEIPTLEALLALVNEYLLMHPDEYWTYIPREVRPRLVATIAELHAWHHKLAAEVGAATNPNIYMQDLCVFFVRASARAMELEQAQQSGKLANDGNFESSGNGSHGA